MNREFVNNACNMIRREKHESRRKWVPHMIIDDNLDAQFQGMGNPNEDRAARKTTEIIKMMMNK